MIKSMTGFGRYEVTEEIGKIMVEMKAVNHRYLDLSIKMPRIFNCFEAQIRNQIKESISRGKVEIYISFEDYREDNIKLRYNSELAKEYVKYAKLMEEELNLTNDLRVSTLMRQPEVFEMETLSEKDYQVLESLLMKALDGATKEFVAARVAEGENLKADLIGKIDELIKVVDEIEAYSPNVTESYRERLTAKIKETLTAYLDGSVTIDEGRILTEVAIYSDKVCTDEETVRLKNHFKNARAELMKSDSVGRKLDFLAQEMNREANTILSKSNDMTISELAVRLKTEIEKIREQIQNIE